MPVPGRKFSFNPDNLRRILFSVTIFSGLDITPPRCDTIKKKGAIGLMKKTVAAIGAPFLSAALTVRLTACPSNGFAMEKKYCIEEDQ